VATTDMDRRTVLARELLGTDPGEQRAVLAEVKLSLEGLDDRTRRKGLLLVTALAVQWSLLRPSRGQTMRLQVEHSPDRLRIVASASMDALPPQFWETVGGAAATAFADSWEWGRSGAWFDIERISS
jgi:hypothetical protein